MRIWVWMKERTKKRLQQGFVIDWNKEAGKQRAGSIKWGREVTAKM